MTQRPFKVKNVSYSDAGWVILLASEDRTESVAVGAHILPGDLVDLLARVPELANRTCSNYEALDLLVRKAQREYLQTKREEVIQKIVRITASESPIPAAPG